MKGQPLAQLMVSKIRHNTPAITSPKRPRAEILLALQERFAAYRWRISGNMPSLIHSLS